MNRVHPERIVRVFELLLNGMSTRSIRRLCNISSVTVGDHMKRVATVSIQYQDELFRSLPLRQVQCDEMHAQVYGHRDKVSADVLERQAVVGDIWTWTAIDTDSKLFVNWLVGGRSMASGIKFFENLKRQVLPTTEVVSDGFRVYLQTVDRFFLETNHRFVVGGFGIHQDAESGAHTNHVERHNLTLRTTIARYQRRSNHKSKDIWYHLAHLGLYSMFYNFCRVHGSLRRETPAMRAGLADHVWTIADLYTLTEERLSETRRGRSREANEKIVAETLGSRVDLTSVNKSRLPVRPRGEHRYGDPLRIARHFKTA
jgi:IS1 family transposase